MLDRSSTELSKMTCTHYWIRDNFVAASDRPSCLQGDRIPSGGIARRPLHAAPLLCAVARAATACGPNHTQHRLGAWAQERQP